MYVDRDPKKRRENEMVIVLLNYLAFLRNKELDSKFVISEK